MALKRSSIYGASSRCSTLVVIFLAGCVAPLFGDTFAPIPVPDTTSGNQLANVYWRTGTGAGSEAPNQNPIGDSVQPGSTLQFWWTDGKKDGTTGVLTPIQGYNKFVTTNTTARPSFYNFEVPNNPKITDWQQTVTTGNKTSDVHTGNIAQPAGSKQGTQSSSLNALASSSDATTGAWQFEPLGDIPDAIFMIPDIAPTQSNTGLDTVYTAVNEQLYMASNPLGFLGGNYKVGDDLGSLGIDIVNGQISGVQGIYFATSPFGFDPNSATGFVPTGGPDTWLNTSGSTALVQGLASSTATGSSGYAIVGIHASTPEPTSWLLLGSGLAALSFLRARLR